MTDASINICIGLKDWGSQTIKYHITAVAALDGMHKIYNTFRQIYRPKYIMLNIAILVMYYLIFNALLSLQEGPIPILSMSPYTVYALLVTASITLTMSVYSIRNTRRNYASITASGASITTTVVGSIVSGCGCSAPLVFTLFSIFGTSSEAVPVYTFFVNYSTQLFLAMTVINVLVTFYYLKRFSTAACRVTRKAAKKPHATAKGIKS
jgi:hypothetical protein